MHEWRLESKDHLIALETKLNDWRRDSKEEM